MLEQARALERQGKFAEAEQLYLQLIRQQPLNFKAWYQLGVMTMEAGWPERALPALERARVLEPHNPAVHYAIGRSLHMQGRQNEALQFYDRAVATAPDRAEFHCDRAIALRETGALDAALAGSDSALVLDPTSSAAHNNRGMVLAALKRPQEALASFMQAIALKPDFADAHNNRALALAVLGQPAEALESLARALAAEPGFATAHANRAMVLGSMGQYAEAVADLDLALAREPANGDWHFERANNLAYLYHLQEALAAYDRALALRPGLGEAWIFRGRVLARLGRLDEALASMDRAVAVGPEQVMAHTNRCLILIESGRFQEALDDARAAGRNPRFTPDTDLIAAFVHLRLGEFENGWRLYEARKTSILPIEVRDYLQPVWLGATPLAGKTLYVHAEQGLGDTIMFSRYLALAKDAGATVVFSPPDALAQLLRTYDPDICILPYQTAPDHFDVHAPLLSLPLAFRTQLDTIPAPLSYLQAEPERVAKWRDRIGGTGFRIGLAWIGSRNDGVGMERSFPLRLCEALADVPGVQLISLQKGDGTAQLADLPPGFTVRTLGEDFDAGPDAFLDTAAAIQSLDLVISCDTAIAHLAGALGRPVWVALKQVPEWRWLLERSDSPWYPTMTLFRQTASGDWGGVFERMAQRLKADRTQ